MNRPYFVRYVRIYFNQFPYRARLEAVPSAAKSNTTGKLPPLFFHRIHTQPALLYSLYRRNIFIAIIGCFIIDSRSLPHSHGRKMPYTHLTEPRADDSAPRQSSSLYGSYRSWIRRKNNNSRLDGPAGERNKNMVLITSQVRAVINFSKLCASSMSTFRRRVC